MPRLIISLVITVLLGASAANSAPAQQSGKYHILLLDVSGSMRDRYRNDLRGWLIQPLLSSNAFSPQDQVIVRWFAKAGDPVFKNHPARSYAGKYDVRSILDNVPTVAHATGLQTDLPEALELALDDIRSLRISSDVFIWMVTDNDQDADGNIDGFYKQIIDEKNFRAAYLYPLARENRVMLARNTPALVMYLLYYSPQNVSPGLDNLADDVGRKIGNEPITWFPLGRGVRLDEAEITVNSEPARFVDGKLLLPVVNEGTPPEFTINFRFNSQLRGREIKQGKIANAMAATRQVPEAIQVEGDVNAWEASISPNNIALKPNQKATTFYLANLVGSMTLHPASFWDAVWGSTSDPIETELQFALTDIQTDLDEAALSRVKNLSNNQNIRNIARAGHKNQAVATIPMSFQLRYDSLWRRVVAALAGLLLVTGAAAGLMTFLSKTKYALSTPNGDQVLSLPMLGKGYLTIDGERAAVIRRRFGKLMIAPLGRYLLDTGRKARELSDGSDFVIESESDDKRYRHSIHRMARAARELVGRDNFYD
jgi:hypothetical protein